MQQQQPLARGFANLGNTCCFSAVLQAMSHTPRFVRFVLQTPHALVQAGRSSAVYASVRHLLACSWAYSSGQGVGAVSPAEVVGAMKPILIKHGVGGDNEQLDAHELYCLVADALCRGCPDRSGMKALLMGSVQRTLRCETCDATTANVTPFTTLDLDLGSSSSSSIRVASLLQTSLAPERITDWTCERCACKRSAALITRAWALPGVLALYVKRAVGADGNSVRRDTVDVDETLTCDALAPLIAPGSPADQRLGRLGPYHLSSVVCHYGSQRGGHYTAVVRHPSALESSDSLRWCVYDDDTASLVGRLPSSVGTACYVLLYTQSQALERHVR